MPVNGNAQTRIPVSSQLCYKIIWHGFLPHISKKALLPAGSLQNILQELSRIAALDLGDLLRRAGGDDVAARVSALGA